MATTPESLPDDFFAVETTGILEAASIKAKIQIETTAKAMVSGKRNAVLETFRPLATKNYRKLAKAIDKAWEIVHTAELISLGTLNLSFFAHRAFTLAKEQDNDEDTLPKEPSDAAFRWAMLKVIDTCIRMNIVMGEIGASKEERRELYRSRNRVMDLLVCSRAAFERRERRSSKKGKSRTEVSRSRGLDAFPDITI